MEDNKEIFRFKKNYREDVVISIYTVNGDDYVTISRSFIDKNGEEQYHKYPISINKTLISNLLVGLQKTVQYLDNDIRVFVMTKNHNKDQSAS
jgi:hypothetical protein